MFQERAKLAMQSLGCCTLCPRACKVNRLEGNTGICNTGRYALVSAVFPHFGEEVCLVGDQGSGTIFFSGCNLGCVFCQNHETSRGLDGQETTEKDLAQWMLALQEQGVANINLVTPSHIVPQIMAALLLAKQRGLHLPVVYNTSSYDNLQTLHLLEGLVQIYLPDMKYFSRASSMRYSNASNYPDIAKEAIVEMLRQTGPLVLNEEGLATSGVLVRHLVMPSLLEESKEIIRWLAEQDPKPAINIMGQYRPAKHAFQYPEIAMRPDPSDILFLRQFASSLGLQVQGAW